MIETDYQELYIKFIRNHNHENDPFIKKQCLNALHQIVYLYPIRRFRCDSDIASDFYTSFFDKIEGIFLEFDPSLNVQFSAFLSLKLKYAFIKYIKQSKHTIIEDQYDETGNYEMKLLKMQQYESEEVEENDYLKIRSAILGAIQKLKMDEELSLLILYCFPLKIKHFRELLRRHKSFIIFAEYRKYLEKITKWQIKEKSEKTETLSLLKRLQVLIIETKDKDKIEKYKKRQDALTKKIFNNTGPVTIKMVAYFLKKTVASVFRKIKSGKNKLKKLLKQDYLKIIHRENYG